MLITLRELISLLLHEADNLQAELLALVALAMMLARESNETFGKTDEPDTESTLIDNRLDTVVWLEVLSTIPETAHHERELLGKGSLLELITLVELLSHEFAHLVETEHEDLDTLLNRRLRHSLDSESNNIDSGKREVTTTNGSLRAEAVLEHTSAATHCSYLIVVTLWIIWSPLLMVVERSIEVEEVREETAGRHLACQLVEVVVRVARQVVDTTLLLPDLDREDSSSMVAHALVGRMKKFAHHATTFSRSIGTVVDRREHHLITATRVDSIHIMDESLHSLMNTTYGAVHCLLTHALNASLVAERLIEIVLYTFGIKFWILLSHIILDTMQLLEICHVNIRSEIKVESWDSLTAVHLVLSCLERDTSLNTGSLDTLSRTALGMSSLQTVLKNGIERMLHTSERLGWVIILVVNMDIATLHSALHLLVEQIVIDERLGALAGKLHHHTGRSVGIHIGILASDIIVLGTDDTLENLASLGLTSDASGIAVRDIFTSHIWLCLHELELHEILYSLDTHKRLAILGDIIGNSSSKDSIDTCATCVHCLTDSIFNLTEVEIYSASITLNNFDNHWVKILDFYR